MNFRTVALAGLAVSIAAPALAHHSFAMFDREKSVTLTGVVKEFEWTNPHVWIHMMVPDSAGKPVEWSFEMQAVAAAMTGGWRANTVKPGDQITLVGHRVKGGANYINFSKIIFADGRELNPAIKN